MPDRDTFDLDRAFDDLTSDVGRTSTPRGAARAITSSRRRRAAGAGLAAMTAVAVGGVGIAVLGGSDETRVDPATPAILEPAPLTAQALEDATAPWVTSWTEEDSVALPDAPCARPGRTRPVADESVEFRSGSDVGADRIYSLWASPAQAARVAASMEAGFAGCEDGPMAPTDLEVPGAAVTTYSFADGSDRDGVVWLAVADDRLALLTVVGVDAPPADVRQGVAEALVAGLTYDEAD